MNNKASAPLSMGTNQDLYDAMSSLYAAIDSVARDVCEDGSTSGPLREHALRESYWRVYKILNRVDIDG